MKSLIIILIIPSWVFAQQADDGSTKWNVRSGLYLASENNWGNPGLGLKSEFSYLFHDSFDVSLVIGAFHSVPEWNNEPIYFRNYSSIFTGISLNHKLMFNESNFVRSSVGLIYTNWNSLSITENTSDGMIYYRQTIETGDKLGYILGLEGGRQVSKKISVGLQLSILSYQIFGDIFMIGANCHFKL